MLHVKYIAIKWEKGKKVQNKKEECEKEAMFNHFGKLYVRNNMTRRKPAIGHNLLANLYLKGL